MSDHSIRTPTKDHHGKPNYGPVWALVMTFFSYITSYAIAIIGIGIVIAIAAKINGRDVEQLLDTFQSSTGGQFALGAAVYLSMLWIIYTFMKYRKVSWADIGLSRRPKLSDAIYAIVTSVIYYVAISIILAAVGIFLPGVNLEQEQQLGFDKETQGAALALIFIALVILPPLIEEIVMRGFLYTGIRQKLKIWQAALITSFVFCIAHLQLGEGAPPLYVAAIDTFFLSLFLVYLREKTGSLWAGIFTHGIKNGLAFTLLFILGVG